MWNYREERKNATFYILDAEKREQFLDEIQDFDRLWTRSPNMHSIIFGLPDPIFWKDCSKYTIQMYCERYGLTEVQDGIYSDGFQKAEALA